MLELLVTHQGRPVTHDELIAYAWNEMATPRSNVLPVVIGQLRRKLHRPTMIHTVPKVGYRIDP